MGFLLSTAVLVGMAQVAQQVQNLQDLSNVRLPAAPSNNDVLLYNTALGVWTNGTATSGSSVTNMGNGSNTLLATNLQVYSSGTTNRPLTVIGGTQTNENGVLINSTVNNAALEFAGLVIDVTNTASAGYSWLSMRSNGVEKAFLKLVNGQGYFSTGNGTLIGNAFITGDYMGTSGNQIGFGSSFNSGLGIRNTWMVRWSSGTDGSGSHDVGLARNAAGLLEVNSGTSAAYRDLRLRTVEMYAQPSDPASSATLGMIYAKTNAGTTEVFVIDGAGNVTQISPHARAASPAPPELDTDVQPIVIHHANLFLGTEEFLHLSALAKEVEKISGKKFLYQRQLDPARKRDWATEETAIEQAHAAERAVDLARLADWQNSTNQNKGPQPPVRPAYVKRPKPAWLP